jgi:hypothetical protein
VLTLVSGDDVIRHFAIDTDISKLMSPDLALRQRKLLGVGVAFKIYYVMAWRAGQAGVPQSSLTRAVALSAMTTATAPGKLRHLAHRLTCKEWSNRHLTSRHMK